MHRLELTLSSRLLPGQAFLVPDAPLPLWFSMDRGWPLERHADPPLIYQWHCRMTAHLFTLTHEYSVYSCFKGTKETSIHRREERHLSFSVCSLPLYIPLFSSTSLYMYNQNISSNMQTLISCACFIRGVDQETFFPGTLSKPTQSCTVCAKEKSHLSFVSTHTLIWGFHSWVSSRSPQKPGETQETHLGPSIFPSSAEAQLIPHGLCVFISQQGHT